MNWKKYKGFTFNQSRIRGDLYENIGIRANNGQEFLAEVEVQPQVVLIYPDDSEIFQSFFGRHQMEAYNEPQLDILILSLENGTLYQFRFPGLAVKMTFMNSLGIVRMTPGYPERHHQKKIKC